MEKNKRRGIVLLGTCIIAVILFLIFNNFYNVQPKTVKVSFEVKTNTSDQFKVYYDLTGGKQWSEEDSDKETYKSVNKYEKLTFYIPINSKNIRIDLGNIVEPIEIKNVAVIGSESIKIDKEKFEQHFSLNNDMTLEQTDDGVIAKVSGLDPYIVLENMEPIFTSIIGDPGYITPVLVILALLLAMITSNALKELKNSIKFVKSSMSNKKLIISLAKNDFKQKYVTSYLGIIWGFINPLITIAVYWFVFQVGLRQTDVGDKPFILWFVAGIIPWFFFQEALSTCTNVFIEYSYLVKKVRFKIETLPVIKIISTLFVHCFFILFLIVISSIYGFYPNVYTMQFIYYSLSMIVLIFCVTIFTSSVVLFFRDLGQIIAIIINVGFWATPIGWNIQMLPEVAQKIFKLNPMFYIVNGYRDAFLENIFFWERPYQTLYFWFFCLIMLLVGVKMFNKLRPHFSDVI